jgi:hypothetical protein
MVYECGDTKTPQQQSHEHCVMKLGKTCAMSLEVPKHADDQVMGCVRALPNVGYIDWA